MGRPPKYSADQILDTAEELITTGGIHAATVSAVIDRLGAPSGSVYHRFATRDLMLAHLWIRAAKESQVGLVEALATGEPDAGVAAALHVVGWSRSNPRRAALLAAHRREDLAADWPEELGDELATLNDRLHVALRDYTRSVFGRVTSTNLQTVMFAVIDVPLAAVRRHVLAGERPPRSLDALVERCVIEVLGLDRGDA